MPGVNKEKQNFLAHPEVKANSLYTKHYLREVGSEEGGRKKPTSEY